MNIAKLIDHTQLKANQGKKSIEKLCSEALKYGFYSVCVNPLNIGLCKDYLKDSDVKIATVIGFPLGANTTETKVREAEDAVRLGADELDMVISISRLLDGDYSYVEDEIRRVKLAAGNRLLKVIIECCLLERKDIIKACELSVSAGADFVKTSTGFSEYGARPEDVRLMREVVGPNIGVKASGGIRDYETAIKMIDAGASRLGVSASVAIIEQALKIAK